MVTDKKLNQPRILAKAAETLRQHVGNAVPGDRLRGRLQLIELLAKDLSLGEEQAEHLFWNLVTAGAIVWVGPNGDMRQFGAQNEHWQIDPDTLHPSRFSRIVSTLRHKRPSDDSPGSGDALELLKRAVMARATDVHLDPSGEDVEVRFRIDGRLEHVCLLDRKIAAALISQMKVMAGLDVPDPFRTKEGRIPLPPSLPGWDVRITTTRVGAGQAVALRLHNNTHVLRPIASLGLSPGALAEVNRMLHQRDGLILVTGPTGAGSATHNFRLFVEDIVKRAPHARLTPAACAFLGHDSVMHYTFGSSDELRGDTVFHLLLHHKNETRETEPACCAAAMRAAS